MLYYKPGKITINTLNIVKFSIDVIVRDYGLLDPIVSNQIPVFKPKFRFSLYYLIKIEKRLLKVF